MHTPTIQALLVPSNKRMAFLPRYFGRWMLSAESSIYNTLSRFCKDYHGGYWEFYQLSNGGFYLAPNISMPLSLCITSNGYEGELSSDATGIIVTLYALHALAHKTRDDKLIDRYYWLRDYAGEHKEASAIFAAID